MKRSTHYLLAAVLAGLFGLFLTYRSLTSSEFPLGLYSPPGIHGGDGHWPDFVALHANRTWTHHVTWSGEGNAGLYDYLDTLYRYGLTTILANGDWWGTGSYTDSIPYLVEHYSCGQHKKLEAELEYNQAAINFFTETGENFYYFQHYQGREDQGPPVTWYLTPDSATADNAIYGPHSTIDGPGNSHLNEPNFYWPGGYHYQSRSFQFRVRSKIDTTGYSVSSDDMAYQLIVTTHFLSGSSIDNTLICRVGDYPNNLDFAEDTLQITVTPSGSDTFSYFRYRIRYEDHVPLWIDWIEYMDMEQAYPLFADSATSAQTLAQINTQCDTIEGYRPPVVARWRQSDEPKMSSFDAHGLVNDYLVSHNRKWPQTPFRLQEDFGPLGCKHFALVGRPRVFDIDLYAFRNDHQIGDQTELDTLAEVLDSAYSACGDSAALIFTAQAHGGGTSYARNPVRSEIFVQAYLALAHGAKGISYYLYRGPADGAYQGLVDTSYQHTSPPYAEKWQAVHDVFAQLDSIGDTLLDLERDAAFCVAQAPNFQGAIENIYFEDDDTDYIEVGQFHLPPSTDPDYLILVNRRTDADRHITVETNLSANYTYALLDLYTQERFISSSVNFEWIPFDSGEGRVFKIEQLTDWNWSNDDKIILADSAVCRSLWTTIAAGTTIKATPSGYLRAVGSASIDANGTAENPVIFTELVADSGWQGMEFTAAGTTDTLDHTIVQYAGSPALSMHNNSELYMKDSWIKSASGAGLSCDESDLVLESSAITNCAGHGLILINSKVDIYNDSICYNGNGGSSGIFAISGSVPKIGDTHLSYNDTKGITCLNNGTIAIMLRSSGYPDCGRNTIVENSYIGVLASDTGATYMGLYSDRPGLNSVYDNGTYAVYNSTPTVIWAQYNWWGQNPQFYGWVDTSHALSAPPGDSFFGGPSFTHRNTSRGADGPLPGSLSEAERLNNVAVELFLDGEYYAAIDTFDLVVNQFPGTAPARFALNHLVVCYREADDYADAVAYLNEFLQPPIDPTLAPLALYHKVLNLARLQEYPAAIAIAGNTQLMATMPQDLQEPLMIELGMMQKYGMQNVIVGNGVFEQFLQQFPESPLAPIAAMELGVEWGSQGIYGSGAAAGIGTSELPEEFYLEQNHPNPFNPTTTITFGLPVAAWVRVEVFDVAGRLVGLSGSEATPTTGYFPAGVHAVTFDGSDLPSGIYLLRLQAEDFSAVEKLILLK